MGLLALVWREMVWAHWIESLMELKNVLMCQIGHPTMGYSLYASWFPGFGGLVFLLDSFDSYA